MSCNVARTHKTMAVWEGLVVERSKKKETKKTEPISMEN